MNMMHIHKAKTKSEYITAAGLHTPKYRRQSGIQACFIFMAQMGTRNVDSVMVRSSTAKFSPPRVKGFLERENRPSEN